MTKAVTAKDPAPAGTPALKLTGITKTFASLAGLVFILLLISQFIALFNWSNMPNVIAGKLAALFAQFTKKGVDLRPNTVVHFVLQHAHGA